MALSRILLGGLLLGAALSGVARADDMLTGDQIKTLITGRTIQATFLPKDLDFTVYFDPDGKTATRKQDGTETVTNYHIDGDRQCLYWRGKDRCARIRDNGDGSYDRINDDGEAVVRWNSLSNGRHL